jgi:hypothetical protein
LQKSFQIVLAFQALVFVLVFTTVWLELAVSGLETYPSDSRYYFQAAFESSEKCSNFDGSGLVCIYRLLPSPDFYFFLLLGIFLIYLISIVHRLIKMKPSHAVMASFFLLHPFIPFAIARGLKESLIFMLIGVIFAIPRRYREFSILVLIIGTSFFLMTSRPFGTFLVIIMLAASSVIISKRVILGLVLSILFLPYIFGIQGLNISTFSLFFEHLVEHRSNFSDIEKRVSWFPPALTFYLGPTPIRPFLAFFGEYTYVFGSPATLSILFLGSFSSLATLFALPAIYKKLNSADFAQRFLFYHALSIIIIYSVIYGGSVDTRHRAIFFALIGSVFLWDSVFKAKKSKKYNP